MKRNTGIKTTMILGVGKKLQDFSINFSPLKDIPAILLLLVHVQEIPYRTEGSGWHASQIFSDLFFKAYRYSHSW